MGRQEKDFNQVEEFCISCFFLPFAFQNELENFPLNTIQHCQAVMNSCNYDSILALVCKEPSQSKADLHLFECDEVKVGQNTAVEHMELEYMRVFLLLFAYLFILFHNLTLLSSICRLLDLLDLKF